MKKSQRDKRVATASFYSRIGEYKKIFRSGGSFAGGVTVYGSDKNLAVVTMDGMSESVKFIELKNIRAVLIKRRAMAPRAAVLGFLLLLVLLGLYSAVGEFNSGFIISSLIFTFIFALLYLGVKNCSLRVITEVNDHSLSSVHHYRVAKKLLDFVVEHMQPYLAEEVQEVQEVDPPSPRLRRTREVEGEPDIPPVVVVDEEFQQ